MQPREKKLALAIAIIVVLCGGWMLWGSWSSRLQARTSQIDKLSGDVRKKKVLVARGDLAAKKLTDWQQRSLPTDKEKARSLYQNWLLGLIEKSKFVGADLSTQNMPGRQKVFDRLAFTITGEATLEQLVQFLFEFYRSGHLDQIRRLHIQPVEKSNRLKLNVSVEGLILPTAKHKDELNDQPGKRLAADDVKKYQDTIVKRNLFAEYTPEKPVVVTPPKIEKPPFDPATQAKFTGFTESGDKRQAWIRVFTTNQTLMLGEGDKIEVGTFKGTVTRVGEHDIELAADGKRWLLAMGESLKDAIVIGEDKSAVPAPAATE